MKGLITKKLSMTQAITPDGKAQAITILAVAPNVITQIKNADKDGYFALQLAYPARITSAGKTTLKPHKEFRFPEGDYKVGDTLKADIFEVGEEIAVTGTSKGRGFAGTIKRHKFHRGPMGHGHDHHRAPGSIGPMGIARVQKGRRMAGHMGAETVTVKGMKIVAVDAENNLLAVSGAVPGANKGIVFIKSNG